MKPLSKQFKWSVVLAVIFIVCLAAIDSGVGIGAFIDRLMIRHFGEKDFCLMAYHQEFQRGEHVPMYCFKHLVEYSR